MATYELPFGSFLGFAALVVAFAGDPALRWYAGAG
jgi:prepilin signal peptidase PulO-like enzyme (type II secretory pathway)